MLSLLKTKMLQWFFANVQWREEPFLMVIAIFIFLWASTILQRKQTKKCDFLNRPFLPAESHFKENFFNTV